MTTTDELLSLYTQKERATAYFGEPVTVTEHSLQTAFAAQRAVAADTLIVAALLHDIGHLIDPAPEDIADWQADARHEVTGSRWLAERFGPEMFEPARLHVPAKRYLCATDADYFGRLSAASVLTLKLQGGPMFTAESPPSSASPTIVRRSGCDGGMIREVSPTCASPISRPTVP